MVYHPPFYRMHPMKFLQTDTKDLPSNMVFPLACGALEDYFCSILPDATTQINRVCYLNTSDVLIVASSFGSLVQLNDWYLTLVASRVDEALRIRQLLLAEGLSRVAEWFCKTDNLLKTTPTTWSCFALTIRYEHDKFLYTEQVSERNTPRPVNNWP